MSKMEIAMKKNSHFKMNAQFHKYSNKFIEWNKQKLNKMTASLLVWIFCWIFFSSFFLLLMLVVGCGKQKICMKNTIPQPILFIKKCYIISHNILFELHFGEWKNVRFGGKILDFIFNVSCVYVKLTRIARIEIKWFQLTSSISTSFCVINSALDE